MFSWILEICWKFDGVDERLGLIDFFGFNECLQEKLSDTGSVLVIEGFVLNKILLKA